MKVGDLVKLTNIASDDYMNLRGIVLDIYPDPEGEFGGLKVSVLWTDGDKTQEFWIDLEVIHESR